jgi:hypothetical protein
MAFSIYEKRERMIYLNNISNVQTMFIPKLERESVGKNFFHALSTGTRQKHAFHVRGMESTALYHIVGIELPKIADGEYEYTLSDEKGTLSTGILVIGGQSKPVEYNNDMIYEQYSE